jgi:hypothetical protein
MFLCSPISCAHFLVCTVTTISEQKKGGDGKKETIEKWSDWVWKWSTQWRFFRLLDLSHPSFKKKIKLDSNFHFSWLSFLFLKNYLWPSGWYRILLWSHLFSILLSFTLSVQLYYYMMNSLIIKFYAVYIVILVLSDLWKKKKKKRNPRFPFFWGVFFCFFFREKNWKWHSHMPWGLQCKFKSWFSLYHHHLPCILLIL